MVAVERRRFKGLGLHEHLHVKVGMMLTNEDSVKNMDAS
jgi:hypothetical protein